MAELRVGCSGWDYSDWRGVVYPADLPRRRWFEHYAHTFDTVEINNTFYRLPHAGKVDGWREQAPPGFRYAAKLGQFGTHRKKLKDAATWLPNFTGVMERLGDRLATVLVQLPPRWKANPARLHDFLAVAPSDWRWAVEVRDPSWLCDEVYEVLAAHRAALCIHDLIADHPRRLTADGWTYVRYHGSRALEEPYRGEYGRARLASDAEWLAGLLDDGRDVYAYFNNDYEGFAVTDAQLLRELVTEARSAH